MIVKRISFIHLVTSSRNVTRFVNMTVLTACYLFTLTRESCAGDFVLCILQLIVNAYDSLFPQNKATTSVVISVNVNPNPPVCQPPLIRTAVTGDTAPGDVIADANATDADGVSCPELK